MAPAAPARPDRPAELHVLPHARDCRWSVAPSGTAAPLSWHVSADEATRAARLRATRIYLHDRYGRVHTIEGRR